MRRLFIAKAGVLAWVSAVLLAGCGAAFSQTAVQPIPSKKEMSEMIHEAESHRYLTTKDAAPFHLLADFRYTYGSVTKTGTYELLWSAPERFREEFRLGDDIGETDLA